MKPFSLLFFLCGLLSASKRTATTDIIIKSAKRPKANAAVAGEFIPVELVRVIAFSEILSSFAFAFASTSKAYYKLFTDCSLDYCIRIPVSIHPSYQRVLRAALHHVEGLADNCLKGQHYACLFLSAGSLETSPIIMESVAQFTHQEDVMTPFWDLMKQCDVGHSTWPSIFSIFFPSNLVTLGLFKVAYPWIKLELNHDIIMTYLAVSISRSVFTSYLGVNATNPNNYTAAFAENEQLIEFLVAIFQEDQFKGMKEELLHRFSDTILFFSNTVNTGTSVQFFIRIFGEALPPPSPASDILKRMNDDADPDYLYRIMAIGYLLRLPVEFNARRWGDLNPQFELCHERFLADTMTMMAVQNIETVKYWSLARKIGLASVLSRIATTDALQSIAKSIWTLNDQPSIEFLGLCVATHRQRSRLFNGLLEQLDKFGPDDNLLDRFSKHIPILGLLQLNAADFPQAFTLIMARLDYELHHYVYMRKDEGYTEKMRRLVTRLPAFGELVRSLIEESERLSPLKGFFTTALPSLRLL